MGIVIIISTIHSPCNALRCNDADSGTAARVWRSPLSSTTPSTGIPARRPRRRRARSCLSLTPFTRNPRDRSTLRTLPGRESTYEHTLVVSWYTPIPLCRWWSACHHRPIASLLCAQVVASVCFAVTNGVIPSKRNAPFSPRKRSCAPNAD